MKKLKKLVLIFFILGGLTGLALWLSPSFAETGMIKNGIRAEMLLTKI